MIVKTEQVDHVALLDWGWSFDWGWRLGWGWGRCLCWDVDRNLEVNK